MTSNARELAQIPSTPSGRRNLIINGAAEVNQRSTGTVNNGETYGAVDRFVGFAAAGGTFTLAQSTDSPDGYNNSILATVTSADSSIASGDFYGISQRVEGKNVYHLGFGSSAAKTLKISFWVKSSVTGTFGGAIRNSAANRSFNFSYTVNSANTWEHKTYTIAGDTSGTWLTDTGIGLRVSWSLGDGSSRLQAAGQWGAGNFAGVTGQTNLITTGSATLQLTGVQLEIGSIATEFEHRSFEEEFAACQRYYQKTYPYSTAIGTATLSGVVGSTLRQSDQQTGYIEGDLQFTTRMRAAPTMTVYDRDGTAGKVNYYIGGTTTANYTATIVLIVDKGFSFYSDNTTTKGGVRFAYTADAEL